LCLLHLSPTSNAYRSWRAFRGGVRYSTNTRALINRDQAAPVIKKQLASSTLNLAQKNNYEEETPVHSSDHNAPRNTHVSFMTTCRQSHQPDAGHVWQTIRENPQGCRNAPSLERLA
jgi:hypothetical protein